MMASMTRQSFNDATSDAARQALLDNRGGRHHPKRHRTRRRNAALARVKRNRVRVVLAERAKTLERYRRAVRAYWSGEAEVHP